MSDSLADILGKKSFSEPPEIAIVKKFVQQKFSSPVSVTMGQQQIIIQVSNSALAASLRMQLHELQELVGGHRRLVIRIGQ